MIKILIALLTSAPVLFATAFADSLPIKIQKAWLQAVPPIASDTAAFMKIQNLGQTSIKLVGGISAIATNVQPMITTIQKHDGHKMMGMENVPAFEIPPGDTLELKPGGDHLMLIGLKSHPPLTERIRKLLIPLQILLPTCRRSCHSQCKLSQSPCDFCKNDSKWRGRAGSSIRYFARKGPLT